MLTVVQGSITAFNGSVHADVFHYSVLSTSLVNIKVGASNLQYQTKKMGEN